MEVEMKYAVENKEIAESIWLDEDLLKICDKNTRETVYMKAAYFDTDDEILAKNDIAYRIRMEGTRIVASLKWAGESHDGLHIRNEVNVPVNDEACFIDPDAEIFIESEQGKDLIKLLSGKKLHNIMETRFIRKRMRLDVGDSICELAIDTGDIITDKGNDEICEIEIELYNGSQDCLKEIGDQLQQKYRLVTEDRSKYARGKALLKQIQAN